MTSTCRNLENLIVYIICLLAIKNKQQERLMFSFYFVLYNVTLVGYSLQSPIITYTESIARSMQPIRSQDFRYHPCGGWGCNMVNFC